MARPNPLADSHGIVKTLKALIAGADISYAHKRKLVEKGYLDDTVKITTDAVKAAGRGRKKVEYQVTRRGENLIRLSANWKKNENSAIAA